MSLKVNQGNFLAISEGDNELVKQPRIKYNERQKNMQLGLSCGSNPYLFTTVL